MSESEKKNARKSAPAKTAPAKTAPAKKTGGLLRALATAAIVGAANGSGLAAVAPVAPALSESAPAARLVSKSEAPTSRAREARKTKGVPGLDVYGTVFPGALAEYGRPADRETLFALTEKRVSGFSARGAEYVSEGGLRKRVGKFFKEIENRSYGVPTFAPFEVPGRTGGIVFAPTAPDGAARIVFDPRAEKTEKSERVDADYAAALAAEKGAAKPAKTEKGAKPAKTEKPA